MISKNIQERRSGHVKTTTETRMAYVKNDIILTREPKRTVLKKASESQERHHYLAEFAGYGSKETSGKTERIKKTVILKNIMDDKYQEVSRHMWMTETNKFTKLDIKPGDIISFDAIARGYKRMRGTSDYGFRKVANLKKLKSKEPDVFTEYDEAFMDIYPEDYILSQKKETLNLKTEEKTSEKIFQRGEIYNITNSTTGYSYPAVVIRTEPDPCDSTKKYVVFAATNNEFHVEYANDNNSIKFVLNGKNKLILAEKIITIKEDFVEMPMLTRLTENEMRQFNYILRVSLMDESEDNHMVNNDSDAEDFLISNSGMDICPANESEKGLIFDRLNEIEQKIDDMSDMSADIKNIVSGFEFAAGEPDNNSENYNKPVVSESKEIEQLKTELYIANKKAELWETMSNQLMDTLRSQ